MAFHIRVVNLKRFCATHIVTEKRDEMQNIPSSLRQRRSGAKAGRRRSEERRIIRDVFFGLFGLFGFWDGWEWVMMLKAVQWGLEGEFNARNARSGFEAAIN
jgi:hypothetical protein